MFFLNYYWTWFLLVGISSLLLFRNSKKLKPIYSLITSISFATILSVGLKYIFLRPRPELAIFPYITPSFPSTHIAATFAALPILLKKLPKLKYLFYSYINKVIYISYYFSQSIYSIYQIILIGWV